MAGRETAQTIEWHEECYVNWCRSSKQEIEELRRVTDRVAKYAEDLDLYRKQIDEAKRRGKKSFDRDKFLVSKSK